MFYSDLLPLALAVASAPSSYSVAFYQPVTINGAQLKAGDYTLELKDNGMAVIKQRETVAEARFSPVRGNRARAPYSVGLGLFLSHPSSGAGRYPCGFAGRQPLERSQSGLD